MKWYRWQKIGPASGLLGLCLGLGLAHHLAQLARYPTALPSGWALFASLLFLSLLGIRRRIPFFPGGNAARWLQWHYQIGLLSLFLFLLHINFSLPNGNLEVLLSLLFGIVAGSGLLGGWLYRVLPARIAGSGTPIIFERIPRHRQEIRQEVESLVRKSLTEHGNSAIADFYAHHLLPFFQQSYRLRNYIFYSPYGNQQRHRRMQALYRYLRAEERPIMATIESKVRKVEKLDFQFAYQGLLKAWLFIHIPISASLMIFVLLHLVTILQFYPR